MGKFTIALKIKGKNGVLQKFIDEVGWTQSDFARAIGTNAGTVGHWFNMEALPGPQHMEKICKLLKQLPEDIFPEFLQNPDFLKQKKTWTLYREVDLEFLPFNKVPEIAYTPEYDSFDVTDRIKAVLCTLTPRQETVLRMRFGIDFDKEHTLEEIGHHLNIHKERVRQIEARALRKLKHPTRTKILKGLLKPQQEELEDARQERWEDLDRRYREACESGKGDR